MSYIGRNIRKIRAIKGYSQAEIANILDITRASIGAYEEGRAEPKTDTMMLIAKYFSIPIDTLLTKEITVNELTNFNIKSYHDFNKIDIINIPVIATSLWTKFISSEKIEPQQFITVPENIFKSDFAIEYNSNIKNDIQDKEINILFCSKAAQVELHALYLIIDEQGATLTSGENITDQKNNRFYRIDNILSKPNQVKITNTLESRINKLEKKVFGNK
jgi:transcriptional regulator with XRE-family HTH domain